MCAIVSYLSFNLKCKFLKESLLDFTISTLLEATVSLNLRWTNKPKWIKHSLSALFEE